MKNSRTQQHSVSRSLVQAIAMLSSFSAHPNSIPHHKGLAAHPSSVCTSCRPLRGHNSSLGLCLSALRTDPCKRTTWTLEVGLGHMHKKSLEARFPGTWPRSKGMGSSGEAAGPVHATPCGERQPQNRAL